MAGQTSQLPGPPPSLTAPVTAVKGGEQAMDELLVHVRQQPGCTLVAVVGDIDAATAGRLRARLSEALMTGRPVIADLSQVAFIDAAGLNALAAAARQARTRHGSLHVVSGTGQVRWLIILTGLDQAIPLARTITEAAAALSPPHGTAGKCAARLRRLRQHYALSRWR
jgi:anti-sigma B factor antagonist